MKHSPFDGCFVFITKIYFEPTTDGFPEQHTRPPPVADAGSVCWRSGQNRQRRAGANDDFGHRKSASKQSLRETDQIRPPQPTMRTDLDIGAEKSETTTVSDFFYANFHSFFIDILHAKRLLGRAGTKLTNSRGVNIAIFA